ncbi:NUDIX hydrolase [Mucilaginibacter pedocola]|uniref:Coenzyme A pyrophosphatase n=1 Tax=Mucilaginibacter pedocola TaxID=1792845 RepID=A0A1S9PG51_9SPHI|nr:CoA pyrophosphatase [Mucilaginibacter pedocola]OOQ59867.1 coenzyme A pyrophosphatase [Mucilaginibacter pedocola]
MGAIISFSSFREQLTQRLKQTLPGAMAHQAMEARVAKYLGVLPDESTRKSAVLLLLYPCGDKIYFPLILRRNYTGYHSGEVSFPGGKYELTDKNLVTTALREANEEIGSVAKDVQVLGTLTEIYISPSNFTVLPVVGYMPYRPTFVPDTREVGQIFEVHFSHFSNADHWGISEINIPGDKVLTPYYDLQGHRVWGATAKIINELLFVVSSIKTDIKI